MRREFADLLREAESAEAQDAGFSGRGLERRGLGTHQSGGCVTVHPNNSKQKNKREKKKTGQVLEATPLATAKFQNFSSFDEYNVIKHISTIVSQNNFPAESND